MYSQKPLIGLFKAGKYPGESSVPKHIETVISNVFIFPDKVYKFYKNDNEFFNKGFRDVSGREARFDFTKRDHQWNNALTPAVYVGVTGVRVEDGVIKTGVPESEAEELVMIMNKIEQKDVLFEKLVSDEITAEDSFRLGKQLAERLEKVQGGVSKDYDLHTLFGPRIEDLREWIKSVTDYISEEESSLYCDYLESYRKANKKYFEEELQKDLSTDGDFHSHNAVYTKGNLYLMDTFPPKDAWGVGHKLIPLYRIGTDILALSGKQELFEEFIRGYEEGSGVKVDRELDKFYIIYAAGIAVSYLYMLQRTDISKREAALKFHDFIRKYFEQVRS